LRAEIFTSTPRQPEKYLLGRAARGYLRHRNKAVAMHYMR